MRSMTSSSLPIYSKLLHNCMHDHDDVRYALQQVVMHVAIPVPLTVATCILIAKAHRWEDDHAVIREEHDGEQKV